jgi:hypothetical protein
VDEPTIWWAIDQGTGIPMSVTVWPSLRTMAVGEAYRVEDSIASFTAKITHRVPVLERSDPEKRGSTFMLIEVTEREDGTGVRMKVMVRVS